MTAANYNASLSLLLAHEGGFSNNPRDPGGPTNKGVTQAVYDRHRKATNQAPQSVKLITDAEVSQIYRDDYWNMISGDKLPIGVDYAMFDYAVNSGIAKSIKDMQRTINDNSNFFGVSGQLKVDGIIGQSTIEAITLAAAHGVEELIENYCTTRLKFMKTLKQWSTFGNGWTRRVEGAHEGQQDDDDGVVDLAVRMTQAPVVVANIANPNANPPVPAGTIEVVPPAPIGARAGEQAGKAFGSQVALFRTVQGAGAALAAAGVTGNTALDAAGTVKSHINGTLIGQMALVAFVLATLGGVGLVLLKFFQERNEKHSG